MSPLAFRPRPSVPIYADDLAQVKANLRELEALGARRSYPAHRRPVPLEAIQPALA
jgi:hypothetical protein